MSRANESEKEMNNMALLIQDMKRGQEAISQIKLILEKAQWPDETFASFVAYLCEDVKRGLEAGLSMSENNNPTTRYSSRKAVGKQKMKQIIHGDLYHQSTHGTRMKKPLIREIVTSTPDEDIDGCRWRKYGNKVIKAEEFPRSYYKCCKEGCPATKQVQQYCNGHDDPLKFLVTRYDHHTCNSLSTTPHISADPNPNPSGVWPSTATNMISFTHNVNPSGQSLIHNIENEHMNINDYGPHDHSSLLGSSSENHQNNHLNPVFSTFPSPEYSWGWQF